MKNGNAIKMNQTSEVLTDLSGDAVVEISTALRKLLADVFTLYIKTKNFHWHMSGRHFRDYHLLLDEQATQIFAMTDDIAERARKIGGTTIRSIGDVSKQLNLLPFPLPLFFFTIFSPKIACQAPKPPNSCHNNNIRVAY